MTQNQLMAHAAPAALAAKYASPRPRYTSYPTAPHFHGRVGAKDYTRWLGALAPGSTLSLYLHVPFCDSLCWFCACTTKITRRYEPVARYLRHLKLEMARVADLIPSNHKVTHVHWGGGSPDILSPDDIEALAAETRARFRLAEGAEFAAEVDPRALTPEKIAALARAGLARVSLGVQDFNPTVQAAINRQQSFDTTKAAVDALRAHGVTGVNIDLVYGLPHQTVAGAVRTVEQVISLGPDRLALFGYAHLPARVRHQRLIPDAAVPGVPERFNQAQAVAERLLQAGYARVGLDHFAKPGDALAREPLRRNFQGYTTDAADALIGLGASAIGSLPQGYVQNAPPIADYERRVAAGGLATARGFALSEEDRARAFVIERLMCDLRFPAQALKRRFPGEAPVLLGEAADLLRNDRDGLVQPDGDGFLVTETGRPFLRTICAQFDAYLAAGQATHSVAV